MKKTIRLLTVLMILVVLASTVLVSALSSPIGETIANYDDYGYYAYFDFENYGASSDHLIYMRADTSTNAGGLRCDPFGFVMDKNGVVDGTGKILTEENGNKYYHYVTNGTNNYNAIAVFGMQDSCIIGDAAEISFRFRMGESDTDTKNPSHRIGLVHTRRSSLYNQPHLTADIYGNLYALTGKTETNGVKTPVFTQVYTNGDGKTVGGDGEFMDIAFRWYDVTNTYSVFVNGAPVVEAVPLYEDYRETAYVSQTYNDDFGVEERTVIGDDRTIEVIRVTYKNGEKFTFDVDDVKLSRVETAQKGTVYYENSFDGVYDGMTSLITNTSYRFTGTANKQTDDEGKRLGYFSVANGTTVAIQDNVYQQFTQDSIVVDFKIRGKVTHTSGYKALLRIVNGGNLNTFKMLYVDKEGYIYTENNNANTRIDGYRLDGDTWLNISVVAIKNVDNAGKFGSFKASTANSTSDNSYYFNYYINGNYVGTNPVWQCFEWRNGSTASNHSYVITDYTVGGDIAALDLAALTLVDGTTTANHKIYKTADCRTYYDITFDSNGNQTKYSAMVLTQTTAEDSIRFFTDATFEGAIDDIAVYAGTAPKSAYENANSASGGTLVNVDFASHVFPSVNGTNAMTRSSGADALGTFHTSGIITGSSVRDNKDNPSYSTVSFASGNHFNLFVPMPENVDGVYDFEYSFETTVKNIVNRDTQKQAAFRFFANRFENDSTNASVWLMSVDSSGNVYGGVNTINLYNADGTRAKIDNANWNTLRGDIHYYQDGSTTAFEFSYYLGGELLYLEDGSPAYRIVNSAIASDAVLELFGVNNYRARYTQANANVSIDIKSINISANAKPIYNKVTSGQANINDNVTVIELEVPKYTSDEFDGIYELLSLTKTSAGKEYKLPLLTVDPYKGNISIGMSGFDYELCDIEGEAYTVGDTPLSVAIVYNDINGRIRYYVNGTVAYINLGGEPTAAVELLADEPAFANLDTVSTVGYVLFGGCENAPTDIDAYALNTYNINDNDTAEIVGLQENGITNGLRFIAGLDTLYYNRVGFEMETFIDGVSKGMKDISNNVVFSSIVANDRQLTAQSQGYNYLAAAIVTDLPSKITADTCIEVRSYTELEGTRHYDEKIKIVVTDDGYYFDNDGVVYQNNFDNLTAVPSEWKLESANETATVIVTEGGKLYLDAVDDGATYLYLDTYVGSDYVVQAEITFDEQKNNGSFALLFGYEDTTHFGYAYIKNVGTYGKFQINNGGKLVNTISDSSFNPGFGLNTTHTLTMICKNNKDVSLYIDGNLIKEGSFKDGYDTGKVGIYTNGTSVTIDNFIVRTADSVEAGDTVEIFEISDKNSTGTRIRVASFNLGDFSTATETANIGIDKGNGTEATKAEYRAVFEKVGADIWGLQYDSQYFNGETEESPYDAIYSEIHTNYKSNFTATYNGKAFLTSYDIYDVVPVYYQEVTTSYSETPVGYGHPWFLTGKVMIGGKEISVVSLHFVWDCKEKRAQQIADVIAWAKEQEYCVILGDFNPQDYINKVEQPLGRLNPDSNNVYQEDWAKFIAAGFEPSNGGRFGTYGTTMNDGAPKNPYPWDCVFVSSNIKILDAEPVYEDWMDDHAIVWADIEIN